MLTQQENCSRKSTFLASFPRKIRLTHFVLDAKTSKSGSGHIDSFFLITSNHSQAVRESVISVASSSFHLDPWYPRATGRFNLKSSTAI